MKVGHTSYVITMSLILSENIGAKLLVFEVWVDNRCAPLLVLEVAHQCVCAPTSYLVLGDVLKRQVFCGLLIQCVRICIWVHGLRS
jgi:hypothetical protein